MSRVILSMSSGTIQLEAYIRINHNKMPLTNRSRIAGVAKTTRLVNKMNF